MINYKEQVIPKLKYLGKNGDPEAYFELGKRYELGFKYECDDPDEKDEDLALEYYLKACELSTPYYIKLGRRYLYPSDGGFKQNGLLALDYFRKTGMYLSDRKEGLILFQAILLNLYREGFNRQGAAENILRLIGTMKNNNKGKYNYYFDAGDVWYYGLAGVVDLYKALKLYYYGVMFLIETFSSEIPTYKIKSKSNTKFCFFLDYLKRVLTQLIKRISHDDLKYCLPTYRKYGIADMSVEECLANNSKYALFKLGMAYEYGLSTLTRDIKEAIHFYRQSLSKGCYEAGYKLMLLFRGNNDNVYLYFKNTLSAVVNKMISILTFKLSESDNFISLLKVYIHRLNDYKVS